MGNQTGGGVTLQNAIAVGVHALIVLDGELHAALAVAAQRCAENGIERILCRGDHGAVAVIAQRLAVGGENAEAVRLELGLECAGTTGIAAVVRVSGGRRFHVLEVNVAVVAVVLDLDRGNPIFRAAGDIDGSRNNHIACCQLLAGNGRPLRNDAQGVGVWVRTVRSCRSRERLRCQHAAHAKTQAACCDERANFFHKKSFLERGVC